MKSTTLLVLASLATTASAFGSFGKPRAATPKLPLPTYDAATNTYTRSPDDDGKMPYDAVGAALRHGPVPFFTRVFNADEYEQGVLKYSEFVFLFGYNMLIFDIISTNSSTN